MTLSSTGSKPVEALCARQPIRVYGGAEKMVSLNSPLIYPALSARLSPLVEATPIGGTDLPQSS